MELKDALCEAHNRWQNLESVYNEVTDPAIIDSIIHQMIVAEQYYDKLLNKARTEELTEETIPVR